MKKIFSENIELITTFYDSDLYKKFLFGNANIGVQGVQTR